ncbi:response regulator [Microvirga zambiensis]|uniref:response regulator n=1 Tax=Microvirga zambiensis TaxID=1402137 RepID=UPI00191F447C|nr:response regulator [Microvirga zambiensis]
MNGHPTPQRPVVLLVEDEPFVRMAAADALQDAGFEVIETVHAQAAQEVLRSRDDIRVVFTDVRMPGSMNGLELATLVRRCWPHISLVVTSGHLEPACCLLPEAAVFIAKPYAENTPAQVIQALLA